MGRRGVRVAACDMHASMVDLRIGKKVVGRRRLLWPMDTMCRRIGYRMELLRRAQRAIGGKVRRCLMASLRLDECQVLAGRGMVRCCVHLSGFDAMLGDAWSTKAVAGAMLGIVRSTKAVAGTMFGIARSAKAVAGTMLGGARSAEAVAGTVLGGARSAETVVAAVLSHSCAGEPMVGNSWVRGVMRCHVHRHVHVFGRTRRMGGDSVWLCLMAIMRCDECHVVTGR
jgi:hypothetical protein